MSLSVDASALVARCEAVTALARLSQGDQDEAVGRTDAFAAANRVAPVPIGAEQGRLAPAAHAVHGKGRHPARLISGDCFAHARAKANGAPLPHKGDDLSRTRLA